MDAASEEEDFEAWMAYRTAKRAKINGKGRENSRRQETRTGSGEGRALNAFNRKTGERNRCYTCNVEYHYEPQRPRSENR